MTRTLVGILVGGKATRLSGVAKGMLAAPDTGEPLARRLVRVCRDAIPGAEFVLLGDAPAYDVLGLPSLADDPPGIGPLGALTALFAEAEARGAVALAVAADLPFVTTALVMKIREWADGAPAVAARPSGVWQPLFARYSPAECLPVARELVRTGRLAARGVLGALGERAVAMPLEDAEAHALDDWDTPEDVVRRR